MTAEVFFSTQAQKMTASGLETYDWDGIQLSWECPQLESDVVPRRAKDTPSSPSASSEMEMRRLAEKCL